MEQKKVKKFCDFCKYYSYNDDSIKDKTDLEAYCYLFKRPVAPWEKCGEFKSK
jgi:hypothetical protein